MEPWSETREGAPAENGDGLAGCSNRVFGGGMEMAGRRLGMPDERVREGRR